jgi:hypothetical protein
MAPKQAEADQRERQARIEEDIRRLFARYRRTGRNIEDERRPQATHPARRFMRDAERTARRVG